MKRRLSDDEKELIIKLYNENKTTTYIAKVLNRHQTTIEEFLKKNGFPMRYGRYVTDEELEDIKNMYLSGHTCREIFEKYKHIYSCEESIQKIIRKLGISRGRYSKPVCLKHDYFNNIDTERKAYWIGLLLADGSIVHPKNRSKVIKLELKYEDAYIIEEFVKDVGSDLPVKTLNSGRKHHAYIALHSNIMANDLAKYGIVERKTFKIKDLPNIKDELMPHFIRGYFDGNGCITLIRAKRQRVHSVTAYFAGTKPFLEKLNLYLHNSAGLSYRELIDMNKYNANVYNLRYNRQSDIIKLYEYMYSNSSIYLKRKKQKFIQYFLERNWQIS